MEWLALADSACDMGGAPSWGASTSGGLTHTVHELVEALEAAVLGAAVGDVLVEAIHTTFRGR